jgi:excinuclease UvrABC nuclease subunit
LVRIFAASRSHGQDQRPGGPDRSRGSTAHALGKGGVASRIELIKKYRPRYNVVLKDDKNYILFMLDKRSPYPRLAFTRRVERDGAAISGRSPRRPRPARPGMELGARVSLRKCGDRALANRVRPCL